MKDGQVRYGLICNDRGGIRDDVLVYRWPYGWAMVVNASNRDKIVEHLEANKGGRDVQVIDQTTDHGDARRAGAEGGRDCAATCSRPTRRRSSTTTPPRRGAAGNNASSAAPATPARTASRS